MNMKEAMSAWNETKLEFGSVSYLANEGITGLKMVTDDQSVMMDEYVRLPELNKRANALLIEDISENIDDELSDYHKYTKQANLARQQGRDDIGLILDIIAREEKNHHEILEALIPRGYNAMMEEGYSGERLEYLSDVAVDIIHVIKGTAPTSRVPINQAFIDQWLLRHKRGEVFTTDEHERILKMVEFLIS